MALPVSTQGADHTASPAQPAKAAPPEQGLDVRGAIRLGWYLAETRGRCWWKSHKPSAAGIPHLPAYMLPLRPERTVDESRRQAVKTLAALAAQFGVDGSLAPNGRQARGFTARLHQLLTVLDADDAALLRGPEDRGDPSWTHRDEAWRPLARLMHEWDAAIQDELTARSDLLACAYLLGRGLAECYWGLAPEDEQGTDTAPTSCDWRFLLGSERIGELSRMAGRLAPFLNPLTPVVVSGSLQAWGEVAKDRRWRAAAPPDLYEQLRRWYQLLVLGQDPSTLVAPYATLREWRSLPRAFRAFWPQVLLTVASLAAVAVFIVLLTTGSGSTLAKTLLGLVGTLGVSAAALIGKLKSATQTLLTRLQQDLYSDLVAVEITVVPPHPDDGHRTLLQRQRKSERIVEAAVRQRALTVATPPPPNKAANRRQ